MFFPLGLLLVFLLCLVVNIVMEFCVCDVYHYRRVVTTNIQGPNQNSQNTHKEIRIVRILTIISTDLLCYDSVTVHFTEWLIGSLTLSTLGLGPSD